MLVARQFQSTLSVRRATGTTGKLGEITIKFQSTLSVRRATGRAMALNTMLKISIHALRKESDLAGIGFCGLTSWLFQSTLSVRRAT